MISLDSGIQGINLDWPTGKGREWDWELSDMDMGIFYLQLLQAFFWDGVVKGSGIFWILGFTGYKSSFWTMMDTLIHSVCLLYTT